MKWNRAVPGKLFLAGDDSSKAVLLHAMWLAVARGCLSNDEEALDMCLTYINEARMADGKRPIPRSSQKLALTGATPVTTIEEGPCGPKGHRS